MLEHPLFAWVFVFEEIIKRIGAAVSIVHPDYPSALPPFFLFVESDARIEAVVAAHPELIAPAAVFHIRIPAVFHPRIALEAGNCQRNRIARAEYPTARNVNFGGELVIGDQAQIVATVVFVGVFFAKIDVLELTRGFGPR